MWVTEASIPMTTLPAMSHAKVGAIATSRRPTATAPYIRIIRDATLEDVAEWDKKQKADGVADLGCYCNESGMTSCGVKRVRHRHQQRLAVVDRRYSDRAGEPQKGQRGSGSRALRGLSFQ